MKDTDVGLLLLIKPTPHKIKNIVQDTTPGNNSKMKGTERKVIDKNLVDLFEYQEE